MPDMFHLVSDAASESMKRELAADNSKKYDMKGWRERHDAVDDSKTKDNSILSRTDSHPDNKAVAVHSSIRPDSNYYAVSSTIGPSLFLPSSSHSPVDSSHYLPSMIRYCYCRNDLDSTLIDSVTSLTPCPSTSSIRLIPVVSSTPP